MADYTVSIALPDHKRGDRWVGVSAIGPILINGATPADALTRVRMMFRRRRGTEVYTIDSQVAPVPTPAPDAEVTISNATTWAASIAPIQSFLPVEGQWDWDMEFYSGGDDSPLTLYKGVITVHNDVAR